MVTRGRREGVLSAPLGFRLGSVEYLHAHKLGVRATAEFLGVSYATLLYWEKNYERYACILREHTKKEQEA